jgi:hypothetical protein
MLPFIGPEFVAHLLNERPKDENWEGAAPAARVRSGAFDKPTFLLKVRLAFIEITASKNRKEEFYDNGY